MEEQIHVSLIGGCVVRDALGFHGDKGYKVDRYTQSASPVSIVDPGRIITAGKELSEANLFTAEEFKGYSNFIRRDFTLDIQRNVFDYFFEVESEYLIVDMAGFRRNLLRFMDGDKPIYFTDNDLWYRDAIDILKEKGYITMDYKQIRTDEEIIPLIKKRIYPYLNRLLEHYTVDRIILVERYPVDFYVDGDEMKAFDSDMTLEVKHRMSTAFRIAREYLRGCHVVEFPKNIFADKAHKWGLSRTHYISEFYDYLYEAYNIIMYEKNNFIDETYKIMQLKQACEEKCGAMFETYVHNSLKAMAPKAKIADSCMKYCEYYEKILSQPSSELSAALAQYMRANGYTSCAVYGYTRIGKLMVNILKEDGFAIDFIFENSNKAEIQGIPIYKRGAKIFPKTDVIIIADIMNIEFIKDKYSKITEIPMVDAYEILK